MDQIKTTAEAAESAALPRAHVVHTDPDAPASAEANSQQAPPRGPINV
jgi:hypothetical protein